MDNPSLDHLLERARRGKHGGIEHFLSAVYPPLHRMASSICGSHHAARTVLRNLLRKALDRLADWSDDIEARRWLVHHLIQECRTLPAAGPSGAQTDPLRSQPDGTAYAAMIAALRSLPPQQQEAWILWRLEGFDLRWQAIAMDCSTTAATTHREGADQTLRKLTGESYDALLEKVRHAHLSLAPPPPMALQRVAASVGGVLLRRRVMGWIKRVTQIVLAAFLIWIVYWIWKLMRQ